MGMNIHSLSEKREKKFSELGNIKSKNLILELTLKKYLDEDQLNFFSKYKYIKGKKLFEVSGE